MLLLPKTAVVIIITVVRPYLTSQMHFIAVVDCIFGTIYLKEEILSVILHQVTVSDMYIRLLDGCLLLNPTLRDHHQHNTLNVMQFRGRPNVRTYLRSFLFYVMQWFCCHIKLQSYISHTKTIHPEIWESLVSHNALGHKRAVLSIQSQGCSKLLHYHCTLHCSSNSERQRVELRQSSPYLTVNQP